MSKLSGNPDSNQDATRSSNEMDQILAQTLSMDAQQFQFSSNFNLLTADDTLGDDSLWQSLGLSASSTGQAAPPLFDPFSLPTLNSLGVGIPTASLTPPLGPTHLNCVLEPDLASSPANQAEKQKGKDDDSGIANWVRHPSQAAGYIEGRDCDLLAMVKASRCPKPVKPYLLIDKSRKAELPLSKPALHPSDVSDIVVVATANRNARKHLLLALDVSLLQNSTNPDPDRFLLGMTPIRSYARELHWVSERCLVVAHGTEASIFDISDGHHMTDRSRMSWAHTDEIREISFNPQDRKMFAAGGFDRVLSINDLTRSMTTISAVRLDDVIGSVRWSSFDTQSVTMTTDDGRFFQFDPRTAMRKASLFVDAQKLHLYGHCMFDPNHILLGFGDGEILQVDIRKNMFVQGTKDPFVHAIGDMIYHHQSQSFLFSGQPDFSLWRSDPSKSATLAWSHLSVDSTLTNQYCHAIFGRHSDTVIKTNDLGAIGVYRHVNLA